MRKHFFATSVFGMLSMLTIAAVALPQQAFAAAANCDVTIDNDTSDWEGVEALYSEDGSTTGVDYFWTGSAWTTTEPDSFEYSTNVAQMADLENIKVCNDITKMYLYVDAQHPMFSVFNTETEEYEEFGNPENGGPAMPADFDYWMVYQIQKEGSSKTYYYGIHLIANEGDYGMSNGPTTLALYEDNGDDIFNPDEDEQIVEFDDSAENQQEHGEEEGGKQIDQEGGLEVALDLVNADGVGLFTETNISYGDTVNMSVAMYDGGDFTAQSGPTIGLQSVDATDAFEYRMRRVGVQNVKAKKKFRKRKTVKVTWEAVDAATKYRVRLYNKKGKKLRTITTRNRKKVIKKLEAGTKYQVRVRAIMGEVKSPWSAKKKFRTKQAKTS